MPHSRRTLSERELRDVCAQSFLASGPDRYGIEAEWVTRRETDVMARLSAREMDQLVALQPARSSRITFEPGGQIELSTLPATTISEALDALSQDAACVHRALATLGYTCAAEAVDTRRPPARVLAKARYAAMENFFAAGGTSGSWMMSNTASTQVNVSHEQDDPFRRWYTLNLIGPLLIAAFANSPGHDQRGVPWVSLREAIWWDTDPGRTRPVRLDISPRAAWLDYALDADVAFICAEGSEGYAGVGLLPGLPFGRWLRDGHELGWPTPDDFRYHLSMLFPPIRPRGWLELRVLDALPPLLRTAACLIVAAATTSEGGRELQAVIPHTSHLWRTASRVGLHDARIARATDDMLAVVRRHLALVTADPAHHTLLAEFADRYVHRRRMPADDVVAIADLRVGTRPTTFA